VKTAPLTAPGMEYKLMENLKDPGWKQKIQHLFRKDYFMHLQEHLRQENTTEIFPPQELVFNAFNLTPFHQVREEAAI